MSLFKEFKAFWTCSFTSLLEKGIDKFCKFQGLIGRLNKLRKQISSGAEKR